MIAIRSLLYVPASRPHMLAKLPALPADAGETAAPPVAEPVPAGDERRKEAFLPLELPRGIFYDRPEKAGEWPWILIADDPDRIIFDGRVVAPDRGRRANFVSNRTGRRRRRRLRR